MSAMRVRVRGFCVSAFILALLSSRALAGEKDESPGTYAFRTAEDGLAAANPAQGFGVGATDEGLWVSGGDRVLLSVRGFGWEGRVQPLPPAPPVASGARVEYRRGGVCEWYENRPEGLEQGFTIERPPDGPAGEWFCLEVAARTHLSAALDESRGTVCLSDASGLARLRYGGLAARDAEGRALPVRLDLTPSSRPGAVTIRLSVAARGAAFPVVVDPVLTSHERFRQLAGGNPSDQLGRIVAADGDLAAVGSSLSKETVYIFERRREDGVPWGLSKEVRAFDGLTNITFGCAIALWGHTLAVAAPDGDAVYLYERNQGGINNWGGVKKIPYPDAAIEDEKNFGSSVALHGDLLAVGMPTLGSVEGCVYVFTRHTGGTNNWGLARRLQRTGSYTMGWAVAAWGDTVVANGDFLSGGSVPGQGGCYVFRRHQGGTNNWGLVGTPMSPKGQTNDHLGRAVAIWGDRIVAGAPLARGNSGYSCIFTRDTWDMAGELIGDASKAGEFGSPLSLRGNLLLAGAVSEVEGAAYVFDRDAGGMANWGRVARIRSSNATGSDFFGKVAQAEETVLSGAFGYNGGRGAAYFYPLTAAKIDHAATLVPDDAASYNDFGSSVAVAGDVLLAGAWGCNVDSRPEQGAVYVYRRNADDDAPWVKAARLLAADGNDYHEFGYSVGLDGDTAIVGAPRWDDSPSNTDQGAAYVFERDFGGTNAWGQVKRLTIPGGSSGALFGYAVAIAGGVAVVGRPFEGAGSVWVYERDLGGPDNWGEAVRLFQPAGNTDDVFGAAVAIDGDTIVVGTPLDDVLGVTNKGSAYVYERSDTWTGWSQVKKLVPAGENVVYFGGAVAIAGDTIAVGTDAEHNVGAVHVFERNAGGPANWGEVTNIAAPAGFDDFGTAVAVSRDRVVVSAYDGSGQQGVVEFVYARNPGNENTWELVACMSALLDKTSYPISAALAADEDVIVAGHARDSSPGHTNDGSVAVYHAIQYPTPEIQTAGLQGTTSTIARWSSYQDIEYSLHSTTNLLTGPWTTNPSVIATGTVTEATHALPAGGGLFHRVLLGPVLP